MPGLTREEQETIVRYDHGAKTIHVYSTQRSWWSFCERAGMELLSTQRNRGQVVSKEFVGNHAQEAPGTNLRSALGLNRRRPTSAPESPLGAASGR